MVETSIEYPAFNCIHLFSGIGGFNLAAQEIGWNNICSVEIDPWCRKLHKKNFGKIFPNERIHADIRDFCAKEYRGKTDLISGGFPCQPFSVAGQQTGIAHDSYLWHEMLRVISEARPTWVVGENVDGIRSMGKPQGALQVESRKTYRNKTTDYYHRVQTQQEIMYLELIKQDLNQIGYDVQFLSIPASAVGANHKRNRIWILAHSESGGILRDTGKVYEENGEIQGRNKNAESDDTNRIGAFADTHNRFEECSVPTGRDEYTSVFKNKVFSNFDSFRFKEYGETPASEFANLSTESLRICERT